MAAREPFDIENKESADKPSRASANANVNKQIGGVAVILLCIIGLIACFAFSGSSKNGGPALGALKVMTLNAGSYQWMCAGAGHGVPDHTVSKGTDGEYKVSGTCPAIIGDRSHIHVESDHQRSPDDKPFTGDCAREEIAKQCCGRHVMGGFASPPTFLCHNRGEGLADCDERGEKEPLCSQGAREQLENLVLQSKADVIAIQEDLEFTPLRVPGYVTITSPSAYVNGYVPKDGTPLSEHVNMVEMHDQEGKAIHMVNTLLVRTELLDKEATIEVCQIGAPTKIDGINTPTECGMKISTQEWDELRGKILAGTLKVQGAGRQEGQESIRTVDKSGGPEHIFIAAKQVAALAIINWNGQKIAIASAKLSGGAFDDQLMMGDFAEQEDERLKMAPQMEKVHQVEAMVERLKAKGYGGKMMIMGDFGGPDDFGHWFWNALRGYVIHGNPSFEMHPALATTFRKADLNDQAFNKLLLDEDSTGREGNVFDGDLEQLSKDLRPLLIQTKQGDEGKVEVNAKEIISKLVAFLKPWWTGMHSSLKKEGLHSVYKAEDFEHFALESEHKIHKLFEDFGITLRGTTKLFQHFLDPSAKADEGNPFGPFKVRTRGTVADYVYVSKELLQAVSEDPQKVDETDENRESHKNSGLFAKDRAARYEIVSLTSKDNKHIKEAPEKGFGSAKAWLVPEVLGKITQHAPVVVCLAGSVLASDGEENCKPPGPLYPGAESNPEAVSEPETEPADLRPAFKAGSPMDVTKYLKDDFRCCCSMLKTDTLYNWISNHKNKKTEYSGVCEVHKLAELQKEKCTGDTHVYTSTGGKCEIPVAKAQQTLELLGVDREKAKKLIESNGGAVAMPSEGKRGEGGGEGGEGGEEGGEGGEEEDPQQDDEGEQNLE